jgi:hypothetical protein
MQKVTEAARFKNVKMYLIKTIVIDALLFYVSLHSVFYSFQSITVLMTATPFSLKFKDLYVSESKIKLPKYWIYLYL